MRLATRIDPYIPSRRLDRLCEHFSIPHNRAHAAHSDASASAKLLAVCLERLDIGSESELSSIGLKTELPHPSAWPILPRLNKKYTRRSAVQSANAKPSYIAQLVSKLPASQEAGGEIAEYLHVLDAALEDRRITIDEGDKLLAISVQHGLSRSDAIHAHEEYMLDLCRLAWHDGIIADSEQRDLEDVRKLLQISSERFRTLFEQTKDERFGGHLSKKKQAEVDRIKGKMVCFTGSMRCRVKGQLATRQVAECYAREKGMLVQNTCTKKLDMLVVADPDSMSGKAEKARKYGVRIIAEPVFWQMIGIDVE